MSKVFQNENEKNKEIKETPETESYDYYENEAMENVEEGSFLQETVFSKDSLPSSISQTIGSFSRSEEDVKLESSPKDSEERIKLMLEKWFSLTGKKPRNVPIIRKYYDEAADKIVFFGDRKSEDIDRKREKSLLQEARRLIDLKINFGKVRHEIRIPPSRQGLTCVRFSPDGDFLATSSLSGMVEIRNFPSWDVAINLNTIEQNENLAVLSLKFFPGDSKKLFLGGQSGAIQVFNTESGKLLGASDKLGLINVMDINPNGSVLAMGGKGGALCTVDPLTLKTLWATAWPTLDEITMPGVENEYHKLRIYALKFHPTEINLFVSGGCDGSVKIWDVRIPKAIRSIRGPSIYGEGVDILDDRIITASWRVENSLSLWDFPSGKLIKNISIQNKATKYESEFLYCAQFFKDFPAHDTTNKDTIAIGGSGFNELLVIDIKTEKVLVYFPSFKSIVTLDICGNLIAYGGKESIFRIGEIERRKRSRRYL